MWEERSTFLAQLSNRGFSPRGTGLAGPDLSVLLPPRQGKVKVSWHWKLLVFFLIKARGKGWQESGLHFIWFQYFLYSKLAIADTAPRNNFLHHPLKAQTFRTSLVAQMVRCLPGDPGSIPGSGRSPGEGNGNPLQYTEGWQENFSFGFSTSCIQSLP